jgi:succinoglycan biosynthesis protein ExoO
VIADIDARVASTPLVSLVLAARDVAPYLDEALNSIRAQTLTSFEALVVDDGSRDATREIARRHGEEDPRIRLLEGPARGPAAARNVGIAAARGAWVAIVDADDWIEANRLEALVKEAEATASELIADNLMVFYPETGERSHRWVRSEAWIAPRYITLAQFFESGVKDKVELGYLKPLIRREWLSATGVRYDEDLLIGEDFDLVARLLLHGARYRFLPSADYHYRRRTSSISHRLPASHLRAMIGAARRLERELEGDALVASQRRTAKMIEDLQFAECVAALKRRRPSAILTTLLRPAMRRRLTRAVREGLSKRARKVLSSS